MIARECLLEIERSEGWSSGPYWDRLGGVWTAYYGETKGIGPNSPRLTRAQGEKRLIQRLENDYAPAVDKILGLNANQRSALISFVYNCGPGAIGTDTRVGRLLRQKQWSAASDAMLQWNKAGGQYVKGLYDRRVRERALFLKPVGHTDSYYLTKWERETIETLETERRVAKRHGGWERVDGSHLRTASAAKKALRQRVAVLEREGLDKAYRRTRRRTIIEAIG